MLGSAPTSAPPSPLQEFPTLCRLGSMSTMFLSGFRLSDDDEPRTLKPGLQVLVEYNSPSIDSKVQAAGK